LSYQSIGSSFAVHIRQVVAEKRTEVGTKVLLLCTPLTHRD
jgi:hypothetical protein